RPTVPFREFAYNELRYRLLARTNPDDAERLLADAQAGIDQKYRQYEQMAAVETGSGVSTAADREAAIQ
ncbi:MAG TPA: hypothetical protein PKH39_20090, partial [Woeseiaceae bacterium]|nr:hypothetical protein [Woeseiaceae bacterium]